MKKYCWGDGDVPEIEAHSIKKHEVLREYLLQYIKIVGGANVFQKKLKLTLIDGFAGGGLYVKKTDGSLHEGSPLIFLRTTQEAEYLVAQEKEFTLDAHYFFIEKNKSCFSFLEDTLIKRGFKDRIGNDIFLHNADFTDALAGIIAQIKKHGRAGRCIFLLDQYGYSDVNLSLLRDIFSNLPHAEIILTFAVDFLINYMTNTQECQQRINDLGFSLDLTNLNEDKAQKRWRFAIQHRLYTDMLQTGAKFYTNFFIKSRESNRSYWLLHLSMHPRAKDEMQTLHWNLTNSFIHEGKAGLCMLGYDPKHDSDLNQQTYCFSQNDKELTHETLLEEIPPLLTDAGFSLKDFYTMQCNQTPATLSMMKDVLKELYISGEIDATTQKGNPKRTKYIQDTDIIRRNRQLVLPLF